MEMVNDATVICEKKFIKIINNIQIYQYIYSTEIKLMQKENWTASTCNICYICSRSTSMQYF